MYIERHICLTWEKDDGETVEKYIVSRKAKLFRRKFFVYLQSFHTYETHSDCDFYICTPVRVITGF